MGNSKFPCTSFYLFLIQQCPWGLSAQDTELSWASLQGATLTWALSSPKYCSLSDLDINLPILFTFNQKQADIYIINSKDKSILLTHKENMVYFFKVDFPHVDFIITITILFLKSINILPSINFLYLLVLIQL